LEKLDQSIEAHSFPQEKEMKMVDSSSWVHALRRRGDGAVRERVRVLVTSGQAVWCAAIRLELWAGVGADPERQMLSDLEQRIPELAINDEIWQSACDLADRCRKAGRRAPASDLLIAACARYHGVELESADAHFDLLKTL
jgi:predicted nucleic acid-binding protein